MGQRKTAPLTHSEYVAADRDNSSQTWQARLRLIETMKRVYPRFLERLSCDVFPLYRRLARQDKLAKPGHNFRKALWNLAPLASPYEALTNSGGLKAALSKWAAEFHVEDGWLMDGALRTLQGWYAAPDWRASLKWDTLHGREGPDVVGESFEFHCQGWEIELLTWSAYSRSVRRSFEKKLAVYEKKTHALAASQGLVRAQKKYSPANLEWFALYQFAGMSSKKIADRCGREGQAVDDSTVLKGIKVAMIPPSGSTRTGLLNPNSAMLAAICAIWASEWVRAFRA
jgi:hypothetical protein